MILHDLPLVLSTLMDGRSSDSISYLFQRGHIVCLPMYTYLYKPFYHSHCIKLITGLLVHQIKTIHTIGENEWHIMYIFHFVNPYIMIYSENITIKKNVIYYYKLLLNLPVVKSLYFVPVTFHCRFSCSGALLPLIYVYCNLYFTYNEL